MAWPNETEVLTGVTAGGTAWRRARVYPNGSEDRATVCAPVDLIDGAPAKLVIATHGTGGSDVTMDTGNGVIVRDALLDAGYVVVAGNLHGNTWGNSTGMADLANLYDWCANLWNVTDTMFFGQSQGGGVVMVATRRKVIPTLRAVAAAAPAINYQWVAESGSSSSAIRSAFGASLANFAEKSAVYAPFAAAPADYAGMHFKFWASYADTTTPKGDHSDAFPELGLSARAASFEVVTVTGGHLSADHYHPSDVVDFYTYALESGNVDPDPDDPEDPEVPSDTPGNASVRLWTGTEWVARTPRIWTGTEWVLTTPTIYS